MVGPSCIPKPHIVQSALLTGAMPGSASSPVPDSFYPSLIAALVEARHAARLRQQDVANRLGRPQAFVSRYETRERRLDVADYVAVARAIGVDPAALLSSVLDEGPDAAPV